MYELVIPCMFKKNPKNNLTFFHLEINISCKSAIIMLLITKGGTINCCSYKGNKIEKKKRNKILKRIYAFFHGLNLLIIIQRVITL